MGKIEAGTEILVTRGDHVGRLGVVVGENQQRNGRWQPSTCMVLLHAMLDDDGDELPVRTADILWTYLSVDGEDARAEVK